LLPGFYDEWLEPERERLSRLYESVLYRLAVAEADGGDVVSAVGWAELRLARQLPNMFSTMHLYPINGAASRVGKGDTAWSYRDATWAQVIVGVDPNPANRDTIVAWARSYWEDIHPHCAGGAYVNFMMEEGEDRVKASYRDNYDRLAAVKARYDPANFFRVNQNVRPSRTAEV
jgi:FAD/FMN-containing dehydrogenase